MKFPAIMFYATSGHSRIGLTTYNDPRSYRGLTGEGSDGCCDLKFADLGPQWVEKDCPVEGLLEFISVYFAFTSGNQYYLQRWRYDVTSFNSSHT